jgi:hypothetical protein
MFRSMNRRLTACILCGPCEARSRTCTLIPQYKHFVHFFKPKLSLVLNPPFPFAASASLNLPLDLPLDLHLICLSNNGSASLFRLAAQYAATGSDVRINGYIAWGARGSVIESCARCSVRECCARYCTCFPNLLWHGLVSCQHYVRAPILCLSGDPFTDSFRFE